jgi:fatty-acyl-CoA synthase
MTKADLEGVRPRPLLELTMAGLLEWAASEAPDRVALKQPSWKDQDEISWTYRELLDDVGRLARYLSCHFNYGDHVAIWAPNSAHWFLYQFAASHLGLVLVGLNPAMRAHEVEYMLRKAEVKGLIMDRHFRGADLVELFDEMRARLPLLKTVLFLPDWRDHLSSAHGELPPSPTRPNDPALILFTSGTTGKPKAAVLHQAGCVNVAHFGSERGGLAQGSVWLCTLPVFHSGGPITLCLGSVSQLNTLVVMPPFDPGMVLELIEREKINWAPLVPAMLIPMLEHPNFASTDISSLKALLFGGTTLTPQFLRMVQERTGAVVQTVFGMTEGAGEVIKTAPGDTIDVVSQTVGTPLPYVDVRIVDPLTGEIAELGDVGEIRYRSPYMASEYFGDAEATDALFDGAGYLRTGDLGAIDQDGRVRITGRLKEMIIRSGMNIYPREIEEVLAEYPGVAESAVVGLPHETYGEEVAVAVRAAAGADIDLNALRDYLLGRLARYKIPKYWRQVPDFPRSGFGKIQKFEMTGLFGPEHKLS